MEQFKPRQLTVFFSLHQGALPPSNEAWEGALKELTKYSIPYYVGTGSYGGTKEEYIAAQVYSPDVALKLIEGIARAAEQESILLVYSTGAGYLKHLKDGREEYIGEGYTVNKVMSWMDSYSILPNGRVLYFQEFKSIK